MNPGLFSFPYRPDLEASASGQVPGTYQTLPPTPVPIPWLTLLPRPDGLVWGVGCPPDSHATVLLFDPETGWSVLSDVAVAQQNNPSYELGQDGLIYAIGGRDGSTATNLVKRWDPASPATWTARLACTTARFGHIAVTLADGRILIAGGTDSAGTDLSTSEIYTPSANTWASAAALSRAIGTGVQGADANWLGAWLRGDGTVLALYKLTSGAYTWTRYDPVGNAWAVPSPSEGSCPASLTFIRGGSCIDAKGRIFFTRAPGDGNAKSYIYDTIARKWTTIPGNAVRHSAASCPLADGRFLIAGGTQTTGLQPVLVRVDSPFPTAYSVDYHQNISTQIYQP